MPTQKSALPKAPKCCGKDAVWVVQSATLQYWYCRTCKKEVTGATSAPAAVPHDFRTDQEMMDWLDQFVKDIDRSNGSMSNLITAQVKTEAEEEYSTTQKLIGYAEENIYAGDLLEISPQTGRIRRAEMNAKTGLLKKRPGDNNVDPFRVATRQDIAKLEEDEPCWRTGCRCHEE